jgi:hypothetical protein
MRVLKLMLFAVRVYFIATSRKGGVGVLGQTTKGAELKKGGGTPTEHARPYFLFVQAPTDIESSGRTNRLWAESPTHRILEILAPLLEPLVSPHVVASNLG